MGLGASTEASDLDAQLDDVINREYGFRVHRVEVGSPGELAGLQSILDYIVVANGVRLDADDGTFVQMIAESVDQEIVCTVFNTHTMRTRETVLVPRSDWGGGGLLGVTIRFDIARPLEKHTLHVLDVYPSSPASAAGLDGHNDYVLGVGDLLFDGPDEFGEIVAYNTGRMVRLYVYNVRTEAVREVPITPDQDWGGNGCLGCGVGSGYLHQLPRRRSQPPVALPSASPPAAALPPPPVAPAAAVAVSHPSPPQDDAPPAPSAPPAPADAPLPSPLEPASVPQAGLGATSPATPDTYSNPALVPTSAA